MKKNSVKKLYVALCFLASFVLWTFLVRLVDVEAIGPRDSTVGFSTLNGFFHGLAGTNMTLYTVTDWLGLVPIGVSLGFAILGLVQWIKRRSFCKVDRSLFVLGGFYLTVAFVYLLFEFVVVNYRPVLIEGALEVSYPSSTTMLVLCVMPTAMLQWKDRVQNKRLRQALLLLSAAFVAFMVFGRLFSGVHWLSDIIGGVLISAGLVELYAWIDGI